jgi:large subunit ribosomal protein L24
MERAGTKKIRKGDQVLVCAGNSKGLKGEVIACKADKVLIRGLNIAKKHVKKSKDNPQGGTIEVERPIHASNVCACDAEGNKLKLHIEMQGESDKVLCYMKEGQKEVWRSIKKKQK